MRGGPAGKLKAIARAIYASKPESGRPKMVGFDIFNMATESGEIEVWPENERAFTTFLRLRTQWRIGMSGPTGLDYVSALAIIGQLRLPPSEADDLFEDIRLMECEALETMHEDSDG